MPIYDVTGEDEMELYDALGEDAPAGGSPKVVTLNAKNLPIGFAGADTATVPASSSVTFTFSLDVLLRPDILVIEDAVAPNVMVTDIRVGPISINATSGKGACGDAFRGNSTSPLRAAVAGTPSVPVKVTLMNKTTTAIALAALCLKGPVKRVA